MVVYGFLFDVSGGQNLCDHLVYLPILWYKKKYNPKDNPQLSGRLMCPGSFSFKVGIDYVITIIGMTSMNHLVFLDTRAGELEKILSGIKSMLAKEFDLTQSIEQLVRPGDSLYFLRKNDDCAVRVKATVVRVLPTEKRSDEDLAHILKELQPRLQLTEEQYNYWSAKQRMLLVEFGSAQKIAVIYIASKKITDQSDWIPFEEFSLIT